MASFDRRRFLLTSGVAMPIAAVPPVVGSPETKQNKVTDMVGDERAYTRPGQGSSAFENTLATDDGYLLVGGAQETDEFGTYGITTALTADGDRRWDQEYRSTPQQEIRDMEPQVGPIPEDWITLALETDGGYLLCGWTYFDGPAVFVTRLYLVDENGSIQREESLGELEDASAYSYLTDGVATDEGFLCCGTESPGIMLGSAGWLVRLDAEGSVLEYTRYPATERDIETTTRSDVFRAMTDTANGYVVVGSYEPEPNEPPEGWMLGVDEEGSVRWDERIALEDNEPTIVYDIEPSDVDSYAFLVVGTVGEWPRIGRPTLTDPEVSGDGFVAAYAEDGQRQWLERLPAQPLFCVERTDAGVVAGGSRDGVGWVGAIERTDFEADHPSVVTSLARGEEGILAAGKRINDDATAWAHLLEGPRGMKQE